MDTERNGEFLEILKAKLTPKRLYHSICVAEAAVNLSEKYGCDREKAYTAGLVHDIMKCVSVDEMIQIIESDGVKLTTLEKKVKATLHATAGEIFLRKNLNVTDREILNAVKYHTTGREDMTLLEKVIYVADLISLDREYYDVEKVRAMADENLDKALMEGLSFTIIKNARLNRPIHPDTVKAFNYLAERII